MKKMRTRLIPLLIMAVIASMMPAFGIATLAANDPPYVTVVPDENFRKAIDEAFNKGPEYLLDKPTPDAVRAELAKFKGIIDAKNKGITNVDGLQWLTSAEMVDLSKNKIKDWSVLDLKGTHTDEQAKEYYGFQDDANEWFNVEWKIGGNPFSILPENFGGRLVIDQPATTSSVYDEHFRPRVYLRGNEPASQLFNITRCVVKKQDDGTTPFVDVISAEAKGSGTDMKGNPILTLLPDQQDDHVGDNIRLKFKDVQKTGTQVIAVGIGQDVHYWTADEYDTILK